MTSTDFTPGPTPEGDRSTRSPKDLAKDAIQAVKGEGASFADGAKGMAAERVEQGKETATRTMGDFANAIRKAGDELAQHDQSMAGQMVRKAADGLETLSRSVSNKRPEEMLEAVRDFARENPAAFIAGSVLVGLAIGRFAKSSERHTDEQIMQGGRFAQDQDYGRSAPAYPISGGADYADEPLDDGMGVSTPETRPEF
jgi:hypothetical protein